MITGRLRQTPGSHIQIGVRSATARWVRRAPDLAVAIGAVLATIWASSILWRRLDGLATGAYDLGFFQQVIWNIGTTGRWTSSFHEGSFLGLHFSPILVVPALLQRVVGFEPHVLSLVHAVGIGGLVVASHLFLREVLRPSRWSGAGAALVAVLVPVWPTTQWIIRSDFHPELIGVVLALLAGWAGLRDRPRAMWLLAAAALVTREDVAYAVLVIGLVIRARGGKRMRARGRMLAIVAGVAGTAIFLVIMPLLRDGAPSDTAEYYAWLGAGLHIPTAPVRLPARFLEAILRPEPWLVLLGMIVGLGGLPVLSRRWLALVVPPFAALLLSAHAPQAAIINQYPIILVVPLIVAAGFGGRVSLAWTTRRRRRASSPRAAAPSFVPPVALIVGALTMAWLTGPLPPFASRLPASLTRSSGLDDLRNIVVAIPTDAPVVADEGLVSPLAARPYIGRLAAASPPRADAYIVIDRDAWSPSAVSAARRERLVAWLEAGVRPVVADDGRFRVWGPADEAGGP